MGTGIPHYNRLPKTETFVITIHPEMEADKQACSVATVSVDANESRFMCGLILRYLKGEIFDSLGDVVRVALLDVAIDGPDKVREFAHRFVTLFQTETQSDDTA